MVDWGKDFIEFFACDPALLLRPDMLFRIFLQGILLIGSAFFSGSETALFSLSRLDLQQLRRQRDPSFSALQSLLEQPRRLIISILSGNEIINVTATVNMAGILLVLYPPAKAGLINVLVMVPLLLLFGEVTPKTIAVSDPIKVSTKWIVQPMSVWVKVVAPFRWLIRLVSDQFTTWIVGKETTQENILKVDEFKTLVEGVAQGGEISSMEKSMIFNLLEAGNTEVVEIMTPRTQVTMIDAEKKVSEIITEVRKIRHARIPVYRGTSDHLEGFIHAEDILKLTLEDTDLEMVSLSDLLHPPVLVPPTKKVDEMFDFFVDENAHAAAIFDEFGGIEGFITMKDVIAFIFGPSGNNEARVQNFKKLSEDVFEVPGDMKLNTFNDLTHFGIKDSKMTTIGGVVLRHFGNLPSPGEQIKIDDINFTVLAVADLHIVRLQAAQGRKRQ